MKPWKSGLAQAALATWMVASLISGCGGGGGGGTVSGGTGGGTGGGSNGGTVTGATVGGAALNRTFSVASFGVNDVATVVFGNLPGSTSSSAATVNITSKEESQPALVSRVDEEEESHELPAGLRDQLYRQCAEAAASGQAANAPTLRGRYQELAKGDTVSMFAVKLNQNVTVRKMNADNETFHCSIFAEVVSGQPVISEQVALQIAAAFDSNNPFRTGGGIYDQVRALYGSEWNVNPLGGRDGDTKINIVFLSATSVGGSNTFGYFNPVDEYAKSTFANSNEGEILFINAAKASGDRFDALSTIAHEFQHLIAYNTKLIRNGAFSGTQEDTSIDEGRAVLCEELLGYGLTATGGGSRFLFTVSDAFLRSPHSFPMFQWGSRNGDYGKGYLMLRYLYERLGETAFVNAMQSSDTGLTELNRLGNFNTLFSDWSQALLCTNLAGGVPSQFRYSSGFNTNGTFTIRDTGTATLTGPVPVQIVNPPTGSPSLNANPYAPVFFRYLGGSGGPLQLRCTGATGTTANFILQSPAGTFSQAQ